MVTLLHLLFELSHLNEIEIHSITILCDILIFGRIILRVMMCHSKMFAVPCFLFELSPLVQKISLCLLIELQRIVMECYVSPKPGQRNTVLNSVTQ